MEPSAPIARAGPKPAEPVVEPQVTEQAPAPEVAEQCPPLQLTEETLPLETTGNASESWKPTLHDGPETKTQPTLHDGPETKTQPTLHDGPETKTQPTLHDGPEIKTHQPAEEAPDKEETDHSRCHQQLQTEEEDGEDNDGSAPQPTEKVGENSLSPLEENGGEEGTGRKAPSTAVEAVLVSKTATMTLGGDKADGEEKKEEKSEKCGTAASASVGSTSTKRGNKAGAGKEDEKENATKVTPSKITNAKPATARNPPKASSTTNVPRLTRSTSVSSISSRASTQSTSSSRPSSAKRLSAAIPVATPDVVVRTKQRSVLPEKKGWNGTPLPTPGVRKLSKGGGIGGGAGSREQRGKATKLSAFLFNKFFSADSQQGADLTEEEVVGLVEAYKKSHENRIYPHWKNDITGKECHRIKPNSYCFCGHSYKVHSWFNTETKEVNCRELGCGCAAFDYIYQQGGFIIKCTCKHSHHQHHDFGRGGCAEKGCKCGEFISTFTCRCGGKWSEHSTFIENERERVARGLPADSDIVKQRCTVKRAVGKSACKCNNCKNLMPCAYGGSSGGSSRRSTFTSSSRSSLSNISR